jgi:hypothetical protein
MNFNSLMKNPRILFVLGFALVLFVLQGFFVINNNIHGDAKFHTQFAKESVESGTLVKEQPYRLYSYSNGHTRYMPIPYPLTSESLFSMLYAIAGETALKIYSAFMAAAIYLLVYLVLRKLGNTIAIIGAVAAVLAIGERLFMTPLIEPFLVVVLLGGILMLKKFFEYQDQKYLILSSVFFGTAIAIKQQGLITSIGVMFFLSIYFAFRVINQKERKGLGAFTAFIILMLLIPSLAIADLVGRTGTFAYSPGKTEIPKSAPFYSTIQPILTSNFPVDPAAADALKKQVNYNSVKVSFSQKLRGFILAPFLYYRSVDVNFLSGSYAMLFLLTIGLLLLSLLSIVKKRDPDKLFWSLIFYLVLIEAVSSFILNTPITQYHIFGVILAIILLSRTIFFLYKRVETMTILLCIVLGGFFVYGYLTYISPLWQYSGREDNFHLHGYQDMGNYVRKNIPANVNFLAAETSFRYYSKRNSVWMNENNGYTVSKIINQPDPEKTLHDLSSLSVKYVVIDKSQLQRPGVSDYLPPDGIVKNIDHSKYFKKIYDAYGDGSLVIYEINYE